VGIDLKERLQLGRWNRHALVAAKGPGTNRVDGGDLAERTVPPPSMAAFASIAGMMLHCGK